LPHAAARGTATLAAHLLVDIGSDPQRDGGKPQTLRAAAASPADPDLPAGRSLRTVGTIDPSKSKQR
jgi:hypothetical protein